MINVFKNGENFIKNVVSNNHNFIFCIENDAFMARTKELDKYLGSCQITEDIGHQKNTEYQKNLKNGGRQSLVPQLPFKNKTLIQLIKNNFRIQLTSEYRIPQNTALIQIQLCTRR